jgi:hypothetical protein
MATRACTPTKIDDNTMKFAWAGLLNGDDGVPIDFQWADFADRTVQVSGTFGAGGNMRVAGSNDGGVNFPALNDAFGTALNITVASLKAITEIPLQTKPLITAGDGTTSLAVTIVARRSRSARGT